MTKVLKTRYVFMYFSAVLALSVAEHLAMRRLSRRAEALRIGAGVATVCGSAVPAALSGAWSPGELLALVMGGFGAAGAVRVVGELLDHEIQRNRVIHHDHAERQTHNGTVEEYDLAALRKWAG